MKRSVSLSYPAKVSVDLPLGKKLLHSLEAVKTLTFKICFRKSEFFKFLSHDRNCCFDGMPRSILGKRCFDLLKRHSIRAGIFPIRYFAIPNEVGFFSFK